MHQNNFFYWKFYKLNSSYHWSACSIRRPPFPKPMRPRRKSRCLLDSGAKSETVFVIFLIAGKLAYEEESCTERWLHQYQITCFTNFLKHLATVKFSFSGNKKLHVLTIKVRIMRRLTTPPKTNNGILPNILIKGPKTSEQTASETPKAAATKPIWETPRPQATNAWK